MSRWAGVWMVERQVQLELRIDLGTGFDLVELAESTDQLRRELLELDVLAVELATGWGVPAGSKGVDVQAVGGLIVGLTGSGKLLHKVIDTVLVWVTRGGQRSVRLELDGDLLEVTGVSAHQQRELISMWIDRHREP